MGMGAVRHCLDSPYYLRYVPYVMIFPRHPSRLPLSLSVYHHPIGFFLYLLLPASDTIYLFVYNTRPTQLRFFMMSLKSF